MIYNYRSKEPMVLLVLSGDTTIFQQGTVFKIPAVCAQFRNHLFSTNNKEVAELIERSHSFGKSVWKIDQDEVKLVKQAVQAEKKLNIRGSMTAQTVSKNTQNVFTCEMCGKSFNSDKALRLHKISHRNNVQQSVAVEEKTEE